MNHSYIFTGLIYIFTLCHAIPANIHAGLISQPQEKSGEFPEFQQVLHLKGSPYELGYQQGQRLKNAIASNIKRFIDDKILANQQLLQIQSFLTDLPRILEHVPEDYKQEMKGLADGSNLPYEKIVLLNLFPEMFHCTGMTVSDRATRDGELYHVRVLDYGVGQNLQDTAVLLIVEPEGKIPFLNVSYAGFIGCITGMNARHIALGEIGGKGYGKYDGMPMAFLLRMILEKASSLEEVKNLLSNTARTCEYYYVFSDGETKRSFGAYATGEQLVWIEPGATYGLFDLDGTLSQSALLADKDEKLVITGDMLSQAEYQTILYQDDSKKQYWGLINKQPENCLVITGFPNPQRYPVLIKRILDNYGKIGVKEIQEMVKSPVSNQTNLHNAIFVPATLDVWVAHAGPKGEPAYDQPYTHFNLKTLLIEYN